jgi:molybdopterin molybdotransferase
MLTVAEALELVLQHAQPLAPRAVDLPAALGCVLAEPIVSDIDSPPHDKSVVDGYAVIAADMTAGGAELTVLEEITAGALPSQTVKPGSTTRIMTGAPIPAGADAVVMIEQTQATDARRVRILQSPVRPGQNIMRRATALSRGQTVLAAGKLLRPIELGLLAEVGRRQVPVIPGPKLAVLTTGNELVDLTLVPAAGQIRNSNGPMLAALARCAGADVFDLGIARDDPSELERAIALGLAHDVIVISGGVSAGVLDLVPATLQRLGVAQLFHKVNLKPGKPLWFGARRQSSGNTTLVFGLPGNPVSSLVCFELFVRPAIQKLRGLALSGLRRTSARLTCEHQQRGERPTYWPSVLKEDQVTPLVWQGSADLRTLTDANCLALFPAGEKTFTAGEDIDVLLFDS